MEVKTLITPKLVRTYRLDSTRLDETNWTPEGYLIDTPIVTSCGIFEYHNDDGSIYRELRLPEHVFDKESLASYESRPVILTHDAGVVNKDNVADEIIGTILSPGYRDENDVRAKIVIHDIDRVKQSGFRELSLGYDTVLDETPGTWNGQHYDAIQTRIAINHLALVLAARAGEQARLNIDGKNQPPKGEKGMSKPHAKSKTAADMKKSVSDYEKRRRARLDEQETTREVEEDVVTATDEDTPPATEGGTLAERIQMVKDRRDRRDSDGDPADEEATRAVIAQQDEDITELMEIIELLEAEKDFAQTEDENEEEANTDDNLGDLEAGGDGGKEITIKLDSVEKIVRERIRLGRIGDQLHLDGLEHMDTLAAKKAVVKKLKPTMRLDDKSKTYITAAFDMAVAGLDARKTTDDQRRQMFNSDGKSSKQQQSGAASARQRMIERREGGAE